MGLAWLFRRRRPPAPVAVPYLDPAEELKRKLAETRTEEPAAEPEPEPEAPAAPLEERRQAVHDRARAAIEQMRGGQSRIEGMEGSGKQSFMDRLKEATGVVVDRTREGIEDLQTRTELSRTYGELGRKTVELVESGAVSHPDLNVLVEKIKSLKAELEATDQAETEPASPTEPAPPAG